MTATGRRRPIENAEQKRSDTNTVCTVTLEIKQKMEEPVYVWYERSTTSTRTTTAT